MVLNYGFTIRIISFYKKIIVSKNVKKSNTVSLSIKTVIFFFLIIYTEQKLMIRHWLVHSMLEHNH